MTWTSTPPSTSPPSSPPQWPSSPPHDPPKAGDPMPYITRRRLNMRLAQARHSAAEQTRTELETALDQHLTTFGHRNAELCAEKADLERKVAWLERRHTEQTELIGWFNTTCARLESRVDRMWCAWRSARARASRERTLNNELLDALADNADHGVLRDENRKLHQQVAELTAANQTADIPVGIDTAAWRRALDVVRAEQQATT